MIKVSVIVPVYIVPLEYLQTCLDSLIAQTMRECEFIIVSDGALETECSICENYAKRDSRLKFYKRAHAGVSATRKSAVSGKTANSGADIFSFDIYDLLCRLLKAFPDNKYSYSNCYRIAG